MAGRKHEVRAGVALRHRDHCRDVVRRVAEVALRVEIAERDLDLRGQGDLLGTRQSGMPGYRLAVADVHRHLLEYAHEDATTVFNANRGLTGPQGEALRTLLYLFRKDLALPLLRAG